MREKIKHDKDVKHDKHDQSHSGLKDVRGVPKKGGSGKGNWGSSKDHSEEMDAGSHIQKTTHINVVKENDFKSKK
jgi:hypothetical protein